MHCYITFCIFFCSQLATAGEDFDAINQTLIFESGETAQTFYINISADSIPEIDEYLFAVITRIELNPASLSSVDTSVLPSVAPGNDSLAIIIISENDDARGVVQLSASAVTTAEPSRDFLSLQRLEGTFGNVSVEWEATSLTADGADFSPPGGVVIIPAGESSVPLPLEISEDSVPEFAEMFAVQLVALSGGGRLGVVSSSVVTIAPSDDPNGAFGKCVH